MNKNLTITETGVVSLTPNFKALLNAIAAGQLQDKAQLDLLMKYYNGGGWHKEQITAALDARNWEPLELSVDQVEQGRRWLMNQWKTPAGKERKLSPFGYREQGALETFKSIEFYNFANVAKFGQPAHYVPVYRVIDQTGHGFDYYMYNTLCNIVG